MATATRQQAAGTTKRIVVEDTRSPKVIAVDKWESANEKAERACAARLTARDEVLSLVKHGSMVTASSGQKYMAVNETKPTNSHEKVAKALAAKLGLTPKQLEAEYKKVAGTRTTKEVKAV